MESGHLERLRRVVGDRLYIYRLGVGHSLAKHSEFRMLDLRASLAPHGGLQQSRTLSRKSMVDFASNNSTPCLQ